MTAKPMPRRGRPPRGELKLSRTAIVGAAFRVIEADGIQAVSMRAVGRELGVDAKSLYNHLDGKEALFDAVAEQVLGAIAIPPRTGDPRVDLTAIARAFRAAALANPQAASLVLTRQLASLEGLAPVEAVLGVLRQSGFAPEEAVHLLRAFVATLIGSLLREVSAGPTYGTTDAAGIARREESLRGCGLERVAEAAPQLARFDGAAEYDFALELALDALSVRLAAI